jgi:hypothetical protein
VGKVWEALLPRIDPQDLGFATQDRSWCALIGEVSNVGQSNTVVALCQQLTEFQLTELKHTVSLN